VFDAGYGVNGPRRKPSGCAEQPAVLDASVLAGQTFGDEALARSVLAMFLDQSADVLRVVRDTQDAKARADAAHLLKGSSRAIGAARVSAAAQQVEDLPADAPQSDVLSAVAALHASVAEARAAIAAQIDGNASHGL
jgi:HPt (histidine-containing phosphotransfer) domain-containing protein